MSPLNHQNCIFLKLAGSSELVDPETSNTLTSFCRNLGLRFGYEYEESSRVAYITIIGGDLPDKVCNVEFPGQVKLNGKWVDIDYSKVDFGNRDVTNSFFAYGAKNMDLSGAFVAVQLLDQP